MWDSLFHKPPESALLEKWDIKKGKQANESCMSTAYGCKGWNAIENHVIQEYRADELEAGDGAPILAIKRSMYGWRAMCTRS